MKPVLIAALASLALVACSGVYGPNDARVVGSVPAACISQGALPAASNGPECQAPAGQRRVGSLFVKAE